MISMTSIHDLEVLRLLPLWKKYSGICGIFNQSVFDRVFNVFFNQKYSFMGMIFFCQYVAKYKGYCITLEVEIVV